jgi:hypothetical protein
MQDKDGPAVADKFYKHLFRNGTAEEPDIRDAAEGLHVAVEALRLRGVPFKNWVPFIHFGI